MKIRDYVKAIQSYHYLRFPVCDFRDCHIVHRNCYAAAVSEQRRMSVWVAYCVDLGNLLGDVVLSRNFHRDMDFCLSPSDYKGSGYDMGHAAELASYRAHRNAGETNDTANIWPQLPELNRGPWLNLESFVRKMARQYERVWVVAMPVWMDDIGEIGGVKIPSHYAKVIAWNPSDLEHYAYLIPQDVARDAMYERHTVTLPELSEMTGIEIF